jgi:hypothetical protein
MNSYDRFDLLLLNSLSLSDLVAQVASRKDRELERQFRHVAESLLPRVRRETGYREEISSLLRDLACRWSLGTAPTQPLGDAPWLRWASTAWSGLFFESKVTGGRRKPRLADRLEWASHGRAEPEPALIGRLFGGAADLETPGSLAGRAPDEVVLVRVAQAILDDLAGSHRSHDASVALPHLDDLAGSVSAREVNSALQALFPSAGPDSFLFVDPSRNPGVVQCLLRWPTEGRGSSPPTYHLILRNGTPSPDDLDHAGAASPVPDLDDWTTTARSPLEWTDLLGRLAAAGGRLPTPSASTCRQSAGYLSLRSALLAGAPVNGLFASVHWKGRPTDLVLLNQLLTGGSLAPEYDTDGDYLEAELNHLVSGDPRVGGPSGEWSLPGGLGVRRVPATDGSRRYVLMPTNPQVPLSTRYC